MGRSRHRPRYRLLLTLARAAVFWERLWPRLWPAVGAVGLFLSLALLDLLPRLPGWLHGLVLLGFAAALIAAARHGLGGVAAVGDAAARRRLERDSGLSHRPLTALDDRLTEDTAEDTAETPRRDAPRRLLWQAHLRRMGRLVGDLTVKLPAPGLARRDPYALRAAVLLFGVVALTAGRGDAAGRLERALLPGFGNPADGVLTVEVWITPPAYTRAAPLFLGNARQEANQQPADGGGGGKDEAIRIPAGSALLAQVGGVRGTPSLSLGERRLAFQAIAPQGAGEGAGEKAHRAETTIEGGDRLAITVDGRPIAEWRLDVIPDAPPQVAFMAPPARTRRSHLRLEYEATDDYGVGALVAVIRLSGDGAEAPEPLRLALPLPGLSSKEMARQTSIQDLTAHPWAGLPVDIQLVATDRPGQQGRSGVVTIALPERIFNHPVARAIIEARRKLVTPTDIVRAQVISALDKISSRPRHFFGDRVVFLALRVARARLVHDRTPRGVPSVQALLWDTALRIEDGEFSIAERDLREARKRLMEALEKSADPKQLERLMAELQQALDRYLAALQKELARRQVTPAPFDPSTMETIRGDELRRMIEEAREMARTGSLEAARQMIAQLQRMLDRIASGLESDRPREDVMKAMRMMDGLRGLTRDQQRLLDETFRRLQQPSGPGKDARPGKDTSADARRQAREGAQRQEGLRRRLGDLMRQLDGILGNIPRPLGKAERAMRDAGEALRGGRPGAAVPSQTEAVEALRRATESVGEQIARRLGGLTAGRAEGRGRRPGTGRDPFGRLPGGALGAAADGSVKIPDAMEMRRAREIVRELRRRAGEFSRPKLERDYINRLLERF